MKQTVSVKELKSGGYTRFPRLFIDLLLQDYYPKNKTRLKIGVFIYIFGKLANKPYNYRYAGGKRVSIYEGQCIIHITTMARALGLNEDLAEAVAAPRLEQIVAEARTTMEQTLGSELARLSALDRKSVV